VNNDDFSYLFFLPACFLLKKNNRKKNFKFSSCSHQSRKYNTDKEHLLSVQSITNIEDVVDTQLTYDMLLYKPIKFDSGFRRPTRLETTIPQ